MVNGLLASTSPMLVGDWNLHDGMLVEAAIIPMGAGLQEPPLICLPSVRGLPEVKQKLMKLFVEV